MLSFKTRRFAAASTMLLAVGGLTACGTNFNAATNHQYQPAIGANVRTGDVQLYNAVVVASSNGDLAVSVGLLNTSDSAQTLQSATLTPIGGSGTLNAEPAADVEVAPGQLFSLGRIGELAGLTSDDITVGNYVRLTLTFADAGEVEVEAPVVARNSVYADVAEEPANGGDEERAEDQNAEAQANDEQAVTEETEAGQ